MEKYDGKDLLDLDLLLNSIPGAVVLYEIDEEELHILYCSDGMEKINGWKSEEFCELMEEKGKEFMHPSDIARFEEIVRQIVRTQSKREFIYRARQKDGSKIWIWFQGEYLGRKNGKNLIQATFLNMSNNMNMYEGILDEATSMITIIDAASYEILYANKAAREVTKDMPGKYVDSVCYSYINHRSEPCPHCILLHKKKYAIKELDYGNRSYRMLYKKILWNGRKALLEYSNDITEERQLQKFTKERENTLSQIVRNIPAGLFVFKMKGSELAIIEANPAACNLMGIDPKKTIGSGNQQVMALTHPEDRGLVQKVIEQMRIPGTIVPYEYRQFNKKTKEYRWLSAQAHSVLQDNGDLLIYICYFDDTEKKRANHLASELQIARETGKAKTDFMANMSHDMRTPLNGILGLAALMLEKEEVAELHEDAKQLILSGELLLRLVNDTLDMNKIESGKFHLDIQPTDSRVVFATILTTAKIMARQAGVELLLDLPKIPKENWVPVLADAARLEQILVNIISNAIKFSNPGGVVELHMSTIAITKEVVSDQYCIIDHGIGMCESFLPHLFDPFVQEGRKNDTILQGSGLGMSIVKQLVDLMGGTISVTSKINEGTTIVIRMDYPIYQGELPKLEKNRSTSYDFRGVHVLLCEDHPLNRRILKQILKKQEIIVDTAENGKMGLENFKQSALYYYDIILMDIRMPVMDGIKATKAIRRLERKDAKTIPIFALTANAFEEDKEETKNAGMNEHLAKPIESAVLFDTMAKYIRTTPNESVFVSQGVQGKYGIPCATGEDEE